MDRKEKRKIRRFERCWFKRGRKELFTWLHRYLRLNKDLLEDNIYKEMYEYYRNTLIKYFRRDVKRRGTSDEEYGKLIDVLADIFNRNCEERVNRYKAIIENHYSFWKENPNLEKPIRI